VEEKDAELVPVNGVEEEIITKDPETNALKASNVHLVRCVQAAF